MTFVNKPARHTLKSVEHLDTWDGFTVNFTSDGNAFASELAFAELSFEDSDGNPGLSLTSGTDGGMTLGSVAPNTWQITVDPRQMTMSPKLWVAGLKTTDVEGVVKTRLIVTLPVTSI